MVNCAVVGCTNHTRKTKGTQIIYFRFPNKQDDVAKQWIAACRRKDKINLKHGNSSLKMVVPPEICTVIGGDLIQLSDGEIINLVLQKYIKIQKLTK